MQETMIKWKLRELMARHNIKGVDLARELGVKPPAISNLRKDKMSKMDGDGLNNLCNAISKLAGGKKIKLEELIDYTDDDQTEN